MEYTVLVHHEPDVDMYLVDVPDLPGVITEGRTREEAVENAQNAIKVYLEALREEGRPVPAASYKAYAVAV